MAMGLSDHLPRWKDQRKARLEDSRVLSRMRPTKKHLEQSRLDHEDEVDEPSNESLPES